MTVPGRILGILNSFAVWLALALYIANMAAVLTNGQSIYEARGPAPQPAHQTPSTLPPRSGASH